MPSSWKPKSTIYINPGSKEKIYKFTFEPGFNEININEFIYKFNLNTRK